ncbi:MAG: DNA recombination protein RmuC [Bdellovibrionales bacterium]|nr:DNA recombination protein RmuC [Bdellovibrionales bacterium]
MFTTILLSVLLISSLVALFFMWRSREQAVTAAFTAQTEAAAVRERARLLEEAMTAQQQARGEMSEAFKGVAASALESSMNQFLNLAQATFERANELHKLDSEQRHKAMDALMKPVSEALERYQHQTGALEKDRQRAFQTIDAELKRIAEAHIHLSKETSALKDALRKPHVRGRWGEVQLRNCIELAGMSEYADVSFQDFTSDDEGARHIPDMIVRMPGGRRVIVDAKTPIDAFLNSLEASSEEVRTTEMLRHGRHVKEHVKRLATRAYTDVVKESADFTVLFLPNESFLYAALEAEPDIVEFALQKKVLIATPPTLIGLLKVIRFGWSEQRLAENAQRISEMGVELHKRLCDFVDTYMAVGKHIDKAKDEFEKGRSRLESRVLVQARRFETLGAKSNKSLIEAPASEVGTDV